MNANDNDTGKKNGNEPISFNRKFRQVEKSTDEHHASTGILYSE